MKMKTTRTKRFSQYSNHPMMWVVEAKAGATAPVVDSYVLTMLQGLDSPGWVRTTILKIFSLTHFHEVTTRLWRPCQPPTLTSTEANCSRKRQAPRRDITGNDFSCLFLTSQFYFFRFREGRRVWFDRRSRKHHLASRTTCKPRQRENG